MEESLKNIHNKELFHEVLRRYKCLFRPHGSAAFLGPMGAGKTTQARKLAELNCWCYVNIEDLLISTQNQSDDSVVEAVLKKIKEPICKHGAVFDDFPENLAQAARFDEKLIEKKVKLDQVVEFKCSQDVALQRIKGEDRQKMRDKRYEDVIQHYKSRGNLVHVDGDNNQDIVWNHLKNIFSKTSHRQ
jgi:adenylate kinase